MVELTFEAHLNSTFKHLMYFVLEFDLVRPEELEPLQPLIDKLLSEDDKKWGPRVRNQPPAAEARSEARSPSAPAAAGAAPLLAPQASPTGPLLASCGACSASGAAGCGG